MYTYEDGTLNLSSDDFNGFMSPWARDFAAASPDNVVGLCGRCAEGVLYGDFRVSPEAYDWLRKTNSRWTLVGEIDVYNSWVCKCCRDESTISGFHTACILSRID